MARFSYASAVAALKSGDRIMVTNPDPSKAGDIRRFHLIGAGGGLTSATFAKLVPDLVPVGDGLFADEPSQTFVWGGET
ncbi:hypothetical protein [Neotabrizicola sp. VNH66]|uniref:hypothetical protein n=1 Tax=Neotabrizicola sp. VNH66 TaxID=3400918 RepID=UPI003BFB0D9A